MSTYPETFANVLAFWARRNAGIKCIDLHVLLLPMCSENLINKLVRYFFSNKVITKAITKSAYDHLKPRTHLNS